MVHAREFRVGGEKTVAPWVTLCSTEATLEASECARE